MLYTGTRPALTMSVPVRYSAAAEYAVVDSGLDNTLTQEEQYHQQQQQLQHQQQQQQLNELEQQQQQYAQYEQYEQQYQQEREEEALLYCQLQQQLEAEVQAVRQQQQLMQQRSSMLMSSSSSSGMPGLLDLPNNNSSNIHNNVNVANNINNNMDAISINAILVDDEQPSTSAQAAAAALLVGKSGNGIGDRSAAEMSTDWMRIADEGRYGTPGAAGLEYQKYEQQQQQQTATLENEAGGATGAEPSALKILEEKLHALSSDELYETLKEYDALQDKYHTVLLLPKESRVS